MFVNKTGNQVSCTRTARGTRSLRVSDVLQLKYNY